VEEAVWLQERPRGFNVRKAAPYEHLCRDA
jgi:hypothetical protein